MIRIVIITLLVFWAIIYTIARFFRYFRIVKDYKDQATATIISVNNHIPGRKKEPPALDVVMEYTIDGKVTRSEIVVSASSGEQYEVGNKLDICYYVSGNGAVHIASAGDGPRRLMYGYLAAVIFEIIIYIVIWMIAF